MSRALQCGTRAKRHGLRAQTGSLGYFEYDECKTKNSVRKSFILCSSSLYATSHSEVLAQSDGSLYPVRERLYSEKFVCGFRPFNIPILCVRYSYNSLWYWGRFKYGAPDGWSLLLMSTHLPKGVRLKRQVSAARNRTRNSASTACFCTNE